MNLPTPQVRVYPFWNFKTPVLELIWKYELLDPIHFRIAFEIRDLFQAQEWDHLSWYVRSKVEFTFDTANHEVIRPPRMELTLERLNWETIALDLFKVARDMYRASLSN